MDNRKFTSPKEGETRDYVTRSGCRVRAWGGDTGDISGYVENEDGDLVHRNWDSAGDYHHLYLTHLDLLDVPDHVPNRPSCNWDHVNKDYDWMAADGDGTLWFYSVRPKRSSVHSTWHGDGDGQGRPAETHISVTPGTCEWRDSLVRRPT